MHVIVIGGGISGLAAAQRLLTGGAEVTLLEGSSRLGGKLLAGDVAGSAAVDLGAESMLARRPEGVDLARAAGLGDALQPPTTASASIWSRGELCPMPKGHVMGVPGDPAALGSLLSPEGVERIGQDEELPRTEVGEDVTVGGYVAGRLGREVVDRLVEPLLGGVYAGDAYRISMRSAVPQLFEAAAGERSLLAGVRGIQERAARNAATGPVFMGIEGGIGRLPLAVADACRAAGADIRTGVTARSLTRAGDAAGGPVRWRVATQSGSVLSADAVVVALPAPQAARLLADEVPAAAEELSAIEYASMALITMAFRRADLESVPVGSGFLVPPVDGRTIKAATFSSNKWGWVDAQNPELFVLRTSVGRYGEERQLEREDGELTEVSLRDLHAAIGLTARPVDSVVTRWNGGLPQYPLGHTARVGRIRAAVAGVPGLELCGAAYEGVGIPACAGGGRLAAEATLASAGPGGE
ncbi:protoporphyrinogen oxidase [Streptomyces sp. HNM0574]|uniref:protoporphyrinogen oxidase n=1 Tax=Streptomyces sp. HNM0574 TaxID=2714954 RepID=UPI00146C0912|nr:protoporphyrinogen oxidase [Streptomyces sp. HNM0574]NLU65827.1 protoporphyrinogen oxidase [Streptomyces sp. HNM0574]